MKNGARKNATSFERSKFANYYSFPRDKGYALVVVVARRQFSHAWEKPFRDRIDGKKRTILFLILPFLPFFFFFGKNEERKKHGVNDSRGETKLVETVSYYLFTEEDVARHSFSRVSFTAGRENNRRGLLKLAL